MNPYAQKSGVISQVSSKHEPPEPCTTRKPTPEQALELKIKLPWEGKVQNAHIDTLTKELFVSLENYGLTRGEISSIFGTYQARLISLLSKWGVPKGKPCVQNKAARAANSEGKPPKGKPPIDLTRTYHDTAPGKAKAARLATKPGQTQQQAVAAAATAEDADGLNYQDRHNLGIHTPTEAEKEDVFRPENDLPTPFVPATKPSGEIIEFSDGPSGSTAKLIDFPSPPVPSAKIQITCHGYSLKQLKAFLFVMPDDTAISGVIHISLRGSESNHGT